MGFVTAIGTALGKFVKEMLPTLITEWKKPKQVKQIGGDRETQQSIDDDINEQIDNPRPNISSAFADRVRRDNEDSTDPKA